MSDLAARQLQKLGEICAAVDDVDEESGADIFTDAPEYEAAVAAFFARLSQLKALVAQARTNAWPK